MRVVHTIALAVFGLLCSCGDPTGPDKGTVSDGIYEIALLADSAQSGQDRLYVVRSDGSNWRRVDTTYPSYGPVAWSSDESSIAFAAYAPEQQIVVVPKTGGVPTLTFPTTMNRFSWSPTTTVLYVSKLHLFSTDPWVMRGAVFSTPLTGAAPVVLTSDTMEAFSPIVSPDGLKIAFEGRGRSGVMNQIFIITTDGSNLKRLPTRDPEAFGWSSGSDWIWYATMDSTFKIRTDGSITMLLSPHLIIPAWSPDGLSVAYGLESDIFVMGSDGGTPRNITNPSNLPSTMAVRSFPAWSADGRTITYLTTGSADESGLWAVHHDGTGRRRIAAVARPLSQSLARRRLN